MKNRERAWVRRSKVDGFWYAEAELDPDELNRYPTRWRSAWKTWRAAIDWVLNPYETIGDAGVQQ